MRRFFALGLVTAALAFGAPASAVTTMFSLYVPNQSVLVTQGSGTQEFKQVFASSRATAAVSSTAGYSSGASGQTYTINYDYSASLSPNSHTDTQSSSYYDRRTALDLFTFTNTGFDRAYVVLDTSFGPYFSGGTGRLGGNVPNWQQARGLFNARFFASDEFGNTLADRTISYSSNQKKTRLLP